MRAIPVLFASLAVAGSASGAAPVQTVVAAAPVVALAFDGPSLVYATGDAARDCDRVHVWNVVTGRTTRLGRRTHCESTSTGRGIHSLAVAGTRVLWLHYVGGNIREWTLWTATTTRPAPRRLRFVARDVDAPPPIVLGDGDASRLGDILPYAVGHTVVALRANGARRFAWTAPARVVALSALGGELAVASEGGSVTILDAGGDVVRTETFTGEIDAVKLTGSAVLVQRGRTLELRDGSPRTWTVPVAARLVDATAAGALYVKRRRVHRLAFAGGDDRVVAQAMFAGVEGTRMAVALGHRVTVRPA